MSRNAVGAVLGSLKREFALRRSWWAPAVVGVIVAVSGVRNGLAVLSFSWGMVTQGPD